MFLWLRIVNFSLKADSERYENNDMKNKRKNRLPFSERFAESIDLPLDTFGNLPQVQLCGNREAVVEGYRRVLEYDDNLLRIRAKRMEIGFWGSELTLKCLNRENVIVSGKLERIEFVLPIEEKKDIR